MDIRLDGTNLNTASQLKGMGATRGQIQLAKSGWRSVELDPSSSKHQVKRARLEQGRITRLLKGIPMPRLRMFFHPSSEGNVVLAGSSNNPPPPPGQGRVKLFLIPPKGFEVSLFNRDKNIAGSVHVINPDRSEPGQRSQAEVVQVVHQVAMPIFARMGESA